MTPERWRRVQELFARALELDTGEREAALTAECADDEGLRHEVESLLEAHERTGGFSSRVTPFEDAPPSLGRLEGAIVDGKYRVDASLGTGGMGTVYRATDVRLEREVALKVIRDDLLGEAATAERFRREAVAVARLRHPNVVTIYDYGVAPGLGAYLVMELLQGHSLRVELERRQRLEAREALDVAGQVCNAVAAAHASGIVHRDLKPENVFLEASAGGAAVKVLDFGLAQFTEGAASLRGAITMRGAALGTPAYMSPEQCLGEEADERSDVYALGCLLYEMLAGRPPFVAPTTAALLLKHVNDLPRHLRELTTGVDPSLEAAVSRALAKAPGDRYQTAEAFARAIGRPVRSAGHDTLAPGGATLSSMGAVTAAPDTGPPDPDPPRTNLRHAVTRFVGRQREIAEIREWLGRTRLVTLVGPGGIGKTRLALETARLVLGEHRDGVWVVELAALADPSLVAQAVVSALGVRERRGRSEADLLAEELRDKQLLLVLDNCEHLVDACARLAERLLEEAPGLHVLATSREALGVAGEAAWPVPALAVPASDDEAFESEAAMLFRDRASLARPGLELTKTSAAMIATLCRRLEGSPLAIELAAARVRSLSVEQILERLDDRLRLLAGGQRTAPPRQQAMRATLDWSWDLLTDEERLLLRRLSVFAGGWSLQAAEAICGDAGGDATFAVLDVLTRLVDKSLVTVAERAGEARYGMLETIRVYAAGRLGEANEETLLREKHFGWFVQWAEQAGGGLSGPDQEVWLSRLDADHDNLRAVLRQAAAADGADDTGLRLCAALGQFWYRLGSWSEGIEWAETMLARCPDEASVARARTLYALGLLKMFRSDIQIAIAHLNEAVAMQRALNDEHGLCRTLYSLASATTMIGDHERAIALAEECVAIATAIGNRRMTAMGGSTLGWIAMRCGELDRARDLLERSLALCRDQGRTREVCLVVFNLGQVSVDLGDLEAATAYLNEAAEIAREIGDGTMLAGSTCVLGLVALDRGELEPALSLLKEALVRFHQLRATHDIASTLEGLAHTAAALGDAPRALRIAGATARYRADVGVPLTDGEQAAHDDALATARGALPSEEAERAFAEGYEMPLERAIEYALGTGQGASRG